MDIKLVKSKFFILFYLSFNFVFCREEYEFKIDSKDYKIASKQYAYEDIKTRLKAEYDINLREGLFKHGTKVPPKKLEKKDKSRRSWPKPEKRGTGLVPPSPPPISSSLSSISSSTLTATATATTTTTTTTSSSFRYSDFLSSLSSTKQAVIYPQRLAEYVSVDQANNSISTYKTSDFQKYKAYVKSANRVFPLLYNFQTEVEFLRWERYKASQAAMEYLVSMFVGDLMTKEMKDEGYNVILVVGSTRFGKMQKGNCFFFLLPTVMYNMNDRFIRWSECQATTSSW
jgi:hypothetical protein